MERWVFVMVGPLKDMGEGYERYRIRAGARVVGAIGTDRQCPEKRVRPPR